LPINVLQFHKYLFRGVDGIDSKKATFAKRMPLPYRQQPIRGQVTLNKRSILKN